MKLPKMTEDEFPEKLTDKFSSEVNCKIHLTIFTF